MEKPQYELVIAGGRVIDGSGRAAFKADLAINDGLIAMVGPELATQGARVIDARGHLVTPGFVDIHTHYDAQVTWDPQVSPSSWHGVTTAVMGNCGVGFAPVRKEDRAWLIGLMEGVEDIPGAAMTEGMIWGWETFPQYMDALDAVPLCIDIAAQIPHGALRTYVMGRRGAKQAPASAEELERMGELVEEAMRAGALGFSTSRTLIHKGIDGEYVPGTFAPEAEVFAIGRGMQRANAGVFQLTSNHVDMSEEFEWFVRLARETQRPVSFNLLQSDQAPELWRTLLAKLDANPDDPVFAQVSGRPNGILMTWGGTAHPFLLYPSYMPLHHLPLKERLAKLRAPSMREKLILEDPFSAGEFEDFIMSAFDKMYLLGATPNYEPEASTSAAAIAKREGRSPRAVVFDWLMKDDGKGIIYFPIFNYSHHDMGVLYELLQHPRTRLGLGDGGAHCGAVCDASITSFMLTHWTRDRTRGPKFGLEEMIQTLTSQTASAYGLHDRGLLAPGYRADVNVIDYAGLELHTPYMAYDLPTGARRLLQKASGYRYTLVAGKVAFENGRVTDARAGKLIRGAKAAPR